MRAALIKTLERLRERCAEEAYDGATVRIRAGADANHVSQCVLAVELEPAVDKLLSEFPEMGDGAFEALDKRCDALERAIESHVRGGMVPPEVAAVIPYHAHKLNEYQTLVNELRESQHLANRRTP